VPTILVIDEKPDELSFLERALKDGGYTLRAARSIEDGRAAIERALEPGGGDELDAIILDWTTQDAEAVALLNWLEALPRSEQLEIIVQSAGSVPEPMQAGLDRGVYVHLAKPYEADRLRLLVGAAIASQECRRSLLELTERVRDCFSLLAQGTFELRTPREAELLAAHIGSACDDPQRGVGVLELLINGIEHGNLGISYEEKTRLLTERRYAAELERRLGLEENRFKRVRATLTRIGDHLQILIVDCGPGFDYRRYLVFDKDRFLHLHGRGILLARAAIDVEYFEPGNQVRLTLPLADPTAKPDGSAEDSTCES
jgi:DNA-binding response OmpR family regulator